MDWVCMSITLGIHRAGNVKLWTNSLQKRRRNCWALKLEVAIVLRFGTWLANIVVVLLFHKPLYICVLKLLRKEYLNYMRTLKQFTGTGCYWRHVLIPRMRISDEPSVFLEPRWPPWHPAVGGQTDGRTGEADKYSVWTDLHKIWFWTEPSVIIFYAVCGASGTNPVLAKQLFKNNKDLICI